jgi:hypothetical protein
MSSSSSPVATRRVDANALRTNQSLIVILTVLAFVLGVDLGGAWIVAFVGISLAIGAALPGRGPFQLFYRQVVLPAGVIKPAPRAEDPAPHRFAQALGAGFLTAAAILLFAGVETLGWILAAIVVALALTNLVFGFCAGCFVFFQLRRAGLFA